MNIYNSLIQNGYYVGSAYDIFSEEELIKLENAISNDVKLGYDVQYPDGNYKWLYRLTASPKPDESKPYDPNFNNPISPNQIEVKKKIVKSENMIIDQQWYFTGYSCISDYYDNLSTAKEKITNFIREIYSVTNPINLDPLQITVYEEGDFILPHSDGKSQNRLCALLIYLGSPDNYDSNKGGRLFIQPNGVPFHSNKSSIYDMKISVDPVRPNYVLLDFTQHNLLHAVEICKQKFNRYAILTFPTIVT